MNINYFEKIFIVYCKNNLTTKIYYKISATLYKLIKNYYFSYLKIIKYKIKNIIV